MQESVVLESGEGSEGDGDSGDGDGSGTPGPGGTSTDSNETTTMTTTTLSEESSSDEQEQDTLREQQLNEADLEHLVDMGVPGGAVATVTIEATQQEAAALVHQYKDISDPEDNEGVEEQSVKKKVPIQVSVPAMKMKVTPVKGRGHWGCSKISPSTGAEHVEVGARGSPAPKVKYHRVRQLYQETDADLMPHEGKSLQDHFDWISCLLFIPDGYGKLCFIYRNFEIFGYRLVTTVSTLHQQ